MLSGLFQIIQQLYLPAHPPMLYHVIALWKRDQKNHKHGQKSPPSTDLSLCGCNLLPGNSTNSSKSKDSTVFPNLNSTHSLPFMITSQEFELVVYAVESIVEYSFGKKLPLLSISEGSKGCTSNVMSSSAESKLKMYSELQSLKHHVLYETLCFVFGLQTLQNTNKSTTTHWFHHQL